MGRRYRLTELVGLLGDATIIGDGSGEVSRAASLKGADAESISFLHRADYQAELQRTAAAVVVVINGVRVTPSFAGLTPGIPGLYQVNAQVPAGTAPNLAGTLSVEEAGVSSNSVALAIQ